MSHTQTRGGGSWGEEEEEGGLQIRARLNQLFLSFIERGCSFSLEVEMRTVKLIWNV